ncbi:MAG TPA: outer membrane lipoprotein carrier protein LolA [Geopsychrobacteraceae bacterium]|nr:outer membrane lipoprotein carrier protein LolA [Geopsychrobacteraceae bacterium]
MLRLVLVATALLFFFGSATAAEKIDLQEVLQTLESPFRPLEQGIKGERINDFQAEFLQESHIAAIDRTQHGSGTVSFKFIQQGKNAKGAMFRWEYLKPEAQEIVSDGRTMWFYLPENKQVIKSDMSRLEQQQGENPVTFLSGLGNLGRDFSVAWAVPDHDLDGNPILSLQPRKKSQFIDRLEVVVAQGAVADYVERKKAGELFPIVSTTVVDPNGNLTTIIFQKAIMNREPDAETFQFVPAEGVEVVHSSAQGVGY